MDLEVITDDIFAFPYVTKAPLGVRFPCRTSIIRDGDGLILLSPGPIDDELAEAIEARGAVKTIVAPSLFHDRYFPAALGRFSEADFACPPSLAAKLPDELERPRLRPPVTEFGGDIAQTRIAGAAKFDELVLLHRPSRSLFVTDLMFNVHQASIMTRLAMSMTRSFGGPRVSRLWRYSAEDLGALAESVEAVLSWDFDRIVVNHGDVVQSGGKDALARASNWLRDGRWARRLPATGV